MLKLVIQETHVIFNEAKLINSPLLVTMHHKVNLRNVKLSAKQVKNDDEN